MSTTPPQPAETRHSAELSFSSADFQPLMPDEEPAARQANFLSIAGSGSPIPDYLLHELARADPSTCPVHDYLSLFSRRLYQLFFRGRGQQDLPNQLGLPKASPWSDRIGHLLGLNPQSSAEVGSVRELAALAPALLTGSRDALEACLERLLAQYLQEGANEPARIKIQEYCGQESEIDAAYQNRLGQQRHCIGHSCVLGAQVRDAGSTIQVLVSGLGASQLQAFRERGPATQALKGALDLLLSYPLRVRLKLRPRDAHTHQVRLAHTRLGPPFPEICFEVGVPEPKALHGRCCPRPLASSHPSRANQPSPGERENAASMTGTRF